MESKEKGSVPSIDNVRAERLAILRIELAILGTDPFPNHNWGSGDNVFARSWQQYDPVGRMTATWRDEEGSKGERFAYNPMGQLTSVAYKADQAWTGTPLNAASNASYTVDALNRQGAHYDAVFWGFQANALNQYVEVGGVGVSYDGNFNLTAFNGATFAYNAQNQLVSGSKGAKTVSFTYDGLGRKVKRVVTGSPGNPTTIISYDGWKPLVDYDSNGNLLAANLYGPGADEILVRWVSALQTHLRYHHDVHGNVTFILNDNGTGLERYSYDAFGTPKITDWGGNERTQSAIANRFLFQGREWIGELGIYDYRHRDYFPQFGRFLQTDPTGFDAGDMNLFRYCGNDPVDGSDPTGLVATNLPDFQWSHLMWEQGNSPYGFNDLYQKYVDAGARGGGGGGGANGSGSTPIPRKATVEGRLKLGGNALEPMGSPSHFTDEKITANGTPAAGVTTPELVANKDGSVTAVANLQVRRKDFVKHPELLRIEWQHVDAWRVWVGVMNSKYGRELARFSVNQQGANAMKEFLDPYWHAQRAQQHSDFHKGHDGKPALHDWPYPLED